ncbi:MAG TPA: transglutaminase family protein [Pirellulaceae bacterium]|nr:transglutaminase family protein [Pirellulaceae bacterium]
MTRLRIEHRTHYRYARPVVLGRHRLVLRPREGHDLRIESMQLDITPAHQRVWSRDVFGNSVALVDFLEPAELLEINTEVIVERLDPFPTEQPNNPMLVAYPLVYDPLEATFTASYSALSYPADQQAIQTWLHAQPLPIGPHDAEAVIVHIGERVHREIKYQRRSEKGVQSPGQTLQLRSGSCRDMATLFMDAARVLGIAARFASGYLDCRASEAGHASTHAWTELYLPVLGWRGFDPTLGQPTSPRHVVTGVSNHPRGVMPISGLFTGAASDFLELIVHVKTEKLPPRE